MKKAKRILAIIGLIIGIIGTIGMIVIFAFGASLFGGLLGSLASFY